MTLETLSPSAYAVLVQLFQKPVWDGDLVSKEGRTELITLGLAQRCRFDDKGLAINELTDAGRQRCADAIRTVDVAFAMAIKRATSPTVH